MLKRNLLLKFSSFVLAASMLVGAPAVIYAAQGNTSGTAAAQTAAANAWHPARPATGMGSIVFVNYNGDGAQLSIDMQRGNLVDVKDDNQHTHQFIVDAQNSYTIATAANNLPGRMQVNLTPGTYNYTASVPNIGTLNGTIEVKAGQVTGLSFYGGDPKTIVHNHSQSHNNSEHTSSSIVFTKLLVAQADLTAQAR